MNRRYPFSDTVSYSTLIKKSADSVYFGIRAGARDSPPGEGKDPSLSPLRSRPARNCTPSSHPLMGSCAAPLAMWVGARSLQFWTAGESRSTRRCTALYRPSPPAPCGLRRGSVFFVLLPSSFILDLHYVRVRDCSTRVRPFAHFPRKNHCVRGTRGKLTPVPPGHTAPNCHS